MEMAGTSHDMTGERSGSGNPVYGVYGAVDQSATSLPQLLDRGAALEEIPFDLLVALESDVAALRSWGKEELAALAPGDLLGAVGFDDWWNAALRLINGDSPLMQARQLVIDKAAMYARFAERGIGTPDFVVGALSSQFLADALDRFGPSPILKPTTGGGSRGVFRYREDLSVGENLLVYRSLLPHAKIDSTVPTLVMEY
jgi:hypothetical protein